ncbi:MULTISPECIES: RNA polymerase sigma-70 factor [unclassified Spirosoma]|uniref:RNA polymerase sigma-70 factor n=1 Tax=unclassified Spirosoma TaxID=2621999 RepID=UPI000962170D|nr:MULTISPECIES: RNA polymerase sigma-70 factor [unclassified Spirosoma]MBN8824927.1 RNA polymerase sigma-70 factor [Spirosoma sp.]OJW74753.1 MAG: RNA polymerase sigma-70 factor [Spirosoma sp. 48-14]
MNQPLHLPVEIGQVLPLRQRPELGSVYVLESEETGTPSSGKASWDNELFLRKAFQEDAERGISLLFRQYYALLCSHAVRFVSSKAIAEDIVSDIFYEFQAESRYKSITSSFRAYLFTAVRNRAFDYVRAEMRHNTSLENAELMPAHKTQSPDSITQYEELYHDVENAINAMPVKRRQIYIMHRFEGKKYQEIADELHLSLRTVEAHLFQAMRQIRNTLKDKWLLIACLVGQLWQ